MSAYTWPAPSQGLSEGQSGLQGHRPKGSKVLFSMHIDKNTSVYAYQKRFGYHWTALSDRFGIPVVAMFAYLATIGN